VNHGGAERNHKNGPELFTSKKHDERGGNEKESGRGPVGETPCGYNVR